MDTIKAKEGYRVCVLKSHGELYAQASWWFDEEECTHLRAILDGDRIVMVACLIPMDEYKREKNRMRCFIFVKGSLLRRETILYIGEMRKRIKIILQKRSDSDRQEPDSGSCSLCQKATGERR